MKEKLKTFAIDDRQYPLRLLQLDPDHLDWYQLYAGRYRQKLIRQYAAAIVQQKRLEQQVKGAFGEAVMQHKEATVGDKPLSDKLAEYAARSDRDYVRVVEKYAKACGLVEELRETLAIIKDMFKGLPGAQGQANRLLESELENFE